MMTPQDIHNEVLCLAEALGTWRWRFLRTFDHPKKPLQYPTMMYEIKLECAAPIKQGELVVHDRTNPQHVANCDECKDGRKFRGSGVSFRSN